MSENGSAGGPQGGLTTSPSPPFTPCPPTRKSTKGVTEGSETTVTWAANFANYPGVVDSIEGRNIRIRPDVQRPPLFEDDPIGSGNSWSLPGDTIETHQLLGSVVPGANDGRTRLP